MPDLAALPSPGGPKGQGGSRSADPLEPPVPPAWLVGEIHPRPGKAFAQLVLLALVGILAALLAGCGGNVPPDFADYALCLASCDGTCERQDSGRWRCVPDSSPPSPCGEEGCPAGEVCIDGECEDPAPSCLPGVPWCNETDPPQTCSTEATPCKHNPTTDPNHCELAEDCDEPPPPPPPEPPAPPPPGRCPQGKPQARGPIPHGRGVWDATPAVCKADWTPECYTGRYCHPVACEGEGAADDRAYCEEQLMGGTAPVWQLEVSEGDVCLVPSQWFAVLGGHDAAGRCRRGRGSGKGRLRWRFPNGKATSKWLDIER